MLQWFEFETISKWMPQFFLKDEYLKVIYFFLIWEHSYLQKLAERGRIIFCERTLLSFLVWIMNQRVDKLKFCSFCFKCVIDL